MASLDRAEVVRVFPRERRRDSEIYGRPSPATAEFVQQVRDCLAHLYDPVYLEMHPLTTFVWSESGSTHLNAGKELRQSLVDAIDAILPSEGAPVDSRARRHHTILVLRYVEGLDASTVQRRLALGKSQYYREHERAVAALVFLLRERWRPVERVVELNAVRKIHRTGTHQPDSRAPGPLAWSGTLPVPLTSFVGQEHTVEEAISLLVAVRLLTLTGPAGVGKTRVAVRVAEAVAHRYEHGACFVPLATIADPGLVASAIAHAVGVGETRGKSLIESLKADLFDKHLLLVLDNFEHVIRAAPLVAELLACCPRLTVLVTSQAGLRVTGEQQFPVPPLALPDPRSQSTVEPLAQCPAVDLFVQRARAVTPEFALTPDHATAVADICRRLDGLPLAIELAATRTKLLPPSALLQRLERSLDVLTDGARDVPARQQTLRRALSWSYELLGDGEKRMLRRLAVFAGGCTVESAEAVAGEVGGLDVLVSLVNRSLLVRDVEPNGTPRLRMLETIREYALERLTESGELDETRRAHASHVRALAESAEPEIRGPCQTEWMDRLEREHGNLRAALAWAIDRGEAETALRLAGALAQFWWVRGYFAKGRACLGKALALSGAVNHPAPRAKALRGAVMLAHMQYDYSVARSLSATSLAILRELGDQAGMADTLYTLGAALFYQGDESAARSLFADSLATYRELDDRRGIANCLFRLGNLPHYKGDFAAARPLYEQALAIRREIGDSHGLGYSLCILGVLLTDQGEYAAARACFDECLPILRDLGDKWELSLLLDGVAGLFARQGEHERAVRLGGAAAVLREGIGAPLPPVAHSLRTRWLVPAEKSLGTEMAAALFAQGRAMTLDQAISTALAASADAPAVISPRGDASTSAHPRAVVASGVPEQKGLGPPTSQSVRLTQRETDVLGLLAGGCSNKEIAAELKTSVRTVERHITNVYAKIGAHGRADAISYALRRGIDTPRGHLRYSRGWRPHRAQRYRVCFLSPHGIRRGSGLSTSASRVAVRDRRDQPVFLSATRRGAGP